MNISHLIGKIITVVHVASSGTRTIISGKLIKGHDGMYVVFPDSLIMSFLRSVFTNKKETCIIFPWSAVAVCEGNLVTICDLDDDEIEDLLESLEN